MVMTAMKQVMTTMTMLMSAKMLMMNKICRKEVQPCIPAPIFPLTSCTCHHPTLSEFSQTPPAYTLLLEAYV